MRINGEWLRCDDGIVRPAIRGEILIFVMEKRQRNIIQSEFKEIYQHKRIICLYIPDDFEFMDPELISLLEERVTPYLERNPTPKSDE